MKVVLIGNLSLDILSSCSQFKILQIQRGHFLKKCTDTNILSFHFQSCCSIFLFPTLQKQPFVSPLFHLFKSCTFLKKFVMHFTSLMTWVHHTWSSCSVSRRTCWASMHCFRTLSYIDILLSMLSADSISLVLSWRFNRNSRTGSFFTCTVRPCHFTSDKVAVCFSLVWDRRSWKKKQSHSFIQTSVWLNSISISVKTALLDFSILDILHFLAYGWKM